MKLINEYIVEKLKINKDSRVKEFIPKKGIKSLVLRINSGGFNGKHFADIYPCEIIDVHKDMNEFIVEYHGEDTPRKTPVDFILTKDTNYTAACEWDDITLYFYDPEYCVKEIDNMSNTYKGTGKIGSKDYNFDGYMILKPNRFDGMQDYLDILKLYLTIDNDKY